MPKFKKWTTETTMTTMPNVKDGSVLLNHNRAASGLKVKTHAEVGGAMFNLNQLAHGADAARRSTADRAALQRVY